MIYVCTCPTCGLVVRTENPAGESSCVCPELPIVVPEDAPEL